MARKCELTGKGVQSGHLVSHSNRKTKRKFLPNLCSVTLQSDALNLAVRLRVSANALTLLVDGLDASAAPASRDGWWMTRHLGFARPNEPAPLTRRIDRDVPMPTGVLSLKRLLQVL